MMFPKSLWLSPLRFWSSMGVLLVSAAATYGAIRLHFSSLPDALAGRQTGVGRDVSVATSGNAPVVARPNILTIGSRSEVALGVLAPGSSGTHVYWLSNPTDAPIRIHDIHYSCPCLRLDPLSREIAPRSRIPVSVCVDLGEESDFEGALALLE